ncbi:hypothetical protein AB0L06_43330 [Spirillospora sp. NPDC052269]
MTPSGELQAAGIRLELLTGPLTGIYDPNGTGAMLFAVLAVAAQLDREYIRDKPLEGQQVAAANGNHGGRPKVIGVPAADDVGQDGDAVGAGAVAGLAEFHAGDQRGRDVGIAASACAGAAGEGGDDGGVHADRSVPVLVQNVADGGEGRLDDAVGDVHEEVPTRTRRCGRLGRGVGGAESAPTPPPGAVRRGPSFRLGRVAGSSGDSGAVEGGLPGGSVNPPASSCSASHAW